MVLSSPAPTKGASAGGAKSFAPFSGPANAVPAITADTPTGGPQDATLKNVTSAALPGMPSTAKLVAGGVSDSAAVPPVTSGGLVSSLSSASENLLRQAADVKGSVKDHAEGLMAKGKGFIDDARAKATELLQESIAENLPSEALAALAALDPTGLLDELQPEHFSFSE